MATSRTMPKSASSHGKDDLLVATHIEPMTGRKRLPRGFTAWHYFLSRALDGTKAPGFVVQSFVRLGQLPLEADVILLHLDTAADIRIFQQYFGFLCPMLRPIVVVEYKSPEDYLDLSDLDTVRAYAMLAKRKYQTKFDHDVSIAMLYSHTEKSFFTDCATVGHRFEEIQPGIRQSQSQSMGVYAVDLAQIGAGHPDHPINLLSSRNKQYGGGSSRDALGPFAVLYDEIFQRELKQMASNIPGQKELLEDAQRTAKALLSRMPVEMRLDGIPAEARLQGLAPEDRLKGLPAEDILRGVSADELARLRELLLNPRPPSA